MNLSSPDPITYLDTAAGSPAGRDYKERFLAALDVRPGHTVIDIGCGPGTDLPRIAGAVTGSGRVIGIDNDPRMRAEAARRLADWPHAEIRAGDAHDLPLPDSSADRARTDRVLQHLADPGQAVAAARRVLRPGGVLGMAEPDWDTLTVAGDDLETSRAFARFTAGQVRNPVVGRQLVRLATGAGLRVRSVDALAVVFRDFGTADKILGLRRNSARAVEAGCIAAASAESWIGRLAAEPFLAAFTFYLVTAVR